MPADQSLLILPTADARTWAKSVGTQTLRAQSLSHVRLFATLWTWTVAHQAPLSMGILQARILEWLAISPSRGSFQPRANSTVCSVAGFYCDWNNLLGWQPWVIQARISGDSDEWFYLRLTKFIDSMSRSAFDMTVMKNFKHIDRSRDSQPST